MNSSMKDWVKCQAQSESIELGDKRRKVTEQSIYIACQVVKKEKRNDAVERPKSAYGLAS